MLDWLLNLKDIGILWDLMGLAALIAVVCLAMVLWIKLDRIKTLERSLNKLRKAYQDLDEQAKIIVKTDLELNRTQDELDKKITGLYNLQKVSRSISTTLDEEEIFQRLKKTLQKEFGIDKALLFLFTLEGIPLVKVNIGYDQEKLEQIQAFISKDEAFGSTVLEKEETISSVKDAKEELARVFGVSSYIIAPIVLKEDRGGFLFTGSFSPSSPLDEGDEELVSILATQIGQALENARLFEQTWKSHQELERRVRERTQDLSSALEKIKFQTKRKSEFVSNVSHELRTPLTSIKGYTSILLTGRLGEIPPQAQERLEKINRHSDELTSLINDLLDISRIESGRMKMEVVACNIKEILDAIEDLFSPQVKEKGIELAVDIPENLERVLCDRSQIERVFINLVSNAVKFTPAKGTIRISIHPQDEYIRFDVSDNGLGIAENDIARIFDEFYRVDNPVNQELKGTGLGLSLVKYIIEAHKGKIWVESKVNQGTTFSFTLPKEKVS